MTHGIGLVQAVLGRSVPIPITRLVGGRDHHALRRKMVIEAFDAEFTADAALADATPRRGRIETVMILTQTMPALTPAATPSVDWHR